MIEAKQDSIIEKPALEDKELEKTNGTIWLERQSFRVALMGIFCALTVVLGYMLAVIPNIEVFSMMIFLTGFILGKKDGAISGLMSSFIFCFFNPMGPSPLPLLAFQLAFYSFEGFLGGTTREILKDKKFFKPEEDLYVSSMLVIFGVIGAALTFVFDVFSTMVLALSIFGTLDAFWPNYILGLPFTTLHLIFNTLVFIFILPGLIQLIYKMLELNP